MMPDKTELEILKETATAMGITFSPNIGLEALRKKVDQPEPTEEVVTDVVEKVAPSYKTDGKYRLGLINDAKRLLRIKLVCMHPNKKESRGEYFTFSNSAIGTVTRFVPFDAETHVEACIVTQIRERKFAKVTMKKGSNGFPYPERKLVTEFGVEELTPLTAKELKDLADDQTKRGAIDK